MVFNRLHDFIAFLTRLGCSPLYVSRKSCLLSRLYVRRYFMSVVFANLFALVYHLFTQFRIGRKGRVIFLNCNVRQMPFLILKFFFINVKLNIACKNHCKSLFVNSFAKMHKVARIKRKFVFKTAHPAEMLHIRVSNPVFGKRFISQFKIKQPTISRMCTPG
jgi:hypothetical protein